MEGKHKQVVAATKVLRLGQKRFLLIRPTSWCLSVDLEKKKKKKTKKRMMLVNRPWGERGCILQLPDPTTDRALAVASSDDWRTRHGLFS